MEVEGALIQKRVTEKATPGEMAQGEITVDDAAIEAIHQNFSPMALLMQICHFCIPKSSP